MNIVGLWAANELPDPHIAWVRQTYEAIQPFSTGAPYLNFLGDEGVDRVRAAYGPATYDRLVMAETVIALGPITVGLIDLRTLDLEDDVSGTRADRRRSGTLARPAGRLSGN